MSPANHSRVRAFFIGCIVGTSVYWIGRAIDQQYEQTCNAPCVVKFPKGTQEDEFRFDYQHERLYVRYVKMGRALP